MKLGAKLFPRMLFLMLGASTLGGCWGPAALTEPERLTATADELAPIRATFDDFDLWARYSSIRDPLTRMAYRNDIITARMYAIDINYTNYETRLGADAHGVDFTTAVLSHAASLAVPLINVQQTKDIVSATGGLIGFYGTAYNEKLLLQQTIQHVQAGMRQARYRQAGHILANMRCDAAVYPLGLALSDLEIYYRAGTFSTGLIKVTENVAKATTDAQAEKNKQNPNPTPEAHAIVAANAVDAQIKNEGTRDGCRLTRVVVGGGGRGPQGPPGPQGPVGPPGAPATDPADLTNINTLRNFVAQSPNNMDNFIAFLKTGPGLNLIPQNASQVDATNKAQRVINDASFASQRAKLITALHAVGLL